MPPTTSTDKLSDDFIERRPYQPYCVTEASSRPESPDTLLPRPLFSTPPDTQSTDNNVSSHEDPSLYLVTSPGPSAASNGQIQHGPTTISRTGSDIDIQPDPTNGIAPGVDALLEKLNHIAQAVTPRGSHSLSSAYHETPSPLRTPRLGPQTIPRKPLRIPAHEVSSHERFLPTTPTNDDRAANNITAQSESVGLGESAGGCGHVVKSRETPHSASNKMQEDTLPLLSDEYRWNDLVQSAPTVYNSDYATFSHLGTRSNSTEELQKLKSYEDSDTHQALNGSLRRSQVWDDSGQLPSSEVLYEPRGLLSDSHEEGWAPRRTIPKDARLRYQFGHRPSANIDRPPPTPSHRITPFQQPHFDNSTRSTAALLSPGTDMYTGPRPPPWGSYESLELQRRQRGETRERSEALLYRSKMDSASSLRAVSTRTMSSGDDGMRREVEEYREAILALYPDMAFDGDAGDDGVERCCCCIVM